MDETEKDDTAEAVPEIPFRQRAGRFALERTLVNDQPAAVLAFFSDWRMVVIRCELMYYSDCFDYTALSMEFDPVPIGGIAPWYDVEFSFSDEKNPADRTVAITLRRMG